MNLLGGENEPDPQSYTNHGLRGDPQLYTGSGGRRVSSVVQGGGNIILATSIGYVRSDIPAQTADTKTIVPDVTIKADGDAGVFHRAFVKLSKADRVLHALLWGRSGTCSVRGERIHRIKIEAILDPDFDPTTVDWTNQGDLTYDQVGELCGLNVPVPDETITFADLASNNGSLCSFRPSEGLAAANITGLRMSWVDDESYSTGEIALATMFAHLNDANHFRLLTS